ncbi:MAG TPA: HIRAN domain-containing protein, partial [Flavobacteriales bacterium]|nr:HIRAN domain-containing protein [Flavobacteriales bacterium]
MHRLTFLRTLLGSPALLTLPPFELLGSEEQDRLAWTQDCHQLFVYDGFVRGFQYHAGSRVIGQMKAHDELDLVREYDNEHDPDAVAVYWNGEKLGYLAMFENKALANLIDHGMLLSAYVAY